MATQAQAQAETAVRVPATVLFAAGALLVGAFCGAIAGTPTLANAYTPPDIGTGTFTGAAAGALLFTLGAFLLRHARGGGAYWLGAALVGGVGGAFLGAMFPFAGKLTGAAVGAATFGGLSAWASGRDGARAGVLWRVASLVLFVALFGALSSLFPVVQEADRGGFLFSWLVTGAPTALLGGIAGLLFARQTARHRLLTVGMTGFVVLIAGTLFSLYRVPVQAVQFPAERDVGVFRFNRYFAYESMPASGVVRVPLLGARVLQMHPGVTEDLGFLSAMPGLQELDLTGAAVNDAELANLAHLADLRFLSLARTSISDEGLRHLEGLTALERLELEGTQVTGQGLAPLAGLTHLSVLGLDRTRVDDDGLAHLAGLPVLRELSLYMTGVTDTGLEHLARVPTLEQLDLFMTEVTPDGVAALEEKLPGCTVLH